MTDEEGPIKPALDASFEKRLRQAETRRGAVGEPTATDTTHAMRGSLAGIGLRVGVELVSALAVAVAIGWGLDRWLHTMPLFLIVFVLLGGAAGVANVWRILGPKSGIRN
jgi:ATP synthase protein I